MVVSDLHLEVMIFLKAEHMAHAAAIEAEFVECMAESDGKFQRLLE